MKVEKVANQVEKSESGEPDNLIRLSTGVVLKGRKANPLILLDVMASFVPPTPPTVYMETMGRMIENAADPDYLVRRDAYKTESSNALVQAMVLLGTKLETLPKGFPGPKSDAWIEDMRILGLQVFPEKENWRYLKWVLHVACVDEHDIALIQEVVGRLTGLSKQAVKTAEEFPGSDKED